MSLVDASNLRMNSEYDHCLRSRSFFLDQLVVVGTAAKLGGQPALDDLGKVADWKVQTLAGEFLVAANPVDV